jgi:hypothetical protein
MWVILASIGEWFISFWLGRKASQSEQIGQLKQETTEQSAILHDVEVQNEVASKADAIPDDNVINLLQSKWGRPQ